jgi:phage recombination protein Bet
MPPQADVETEERVTREPAQRQALVVRGPDMAWLDTPRDQLVTTLANSLYPGAKRESVEMVLDYCETARLNVMLKPVHIVPMNVKVGQNKWEWRDIVMPGINHYRVQASRTGSYMGKSPPVFGPEKTEQIGQITVTYPEFCEVTVKRLIGGHVAEFTAVEFWKENFATAGRDKPEPNAMWRKRPAGQLHKCAEAQALRMAFPELVGDFTAEEMEGKVIDLEATDVTPKPAAAKSLDQFAGAPEPEPEDAVVEAVVEDDEPSDEAPDMPPDIAQPFYNPTGAAAPDWGPGWKWLNEAMTGLTHAAKQELATAHARLLWAVYDSDAKAKKGGGPQSKAAQKFCEDHRIVLPPKEEANGDQK